VEFRLLLDNVFGALPASAPPPAIADINVKDGPNLEIVAFDNPQTLILFGHSGIADSDPEYIPAVVMMELLGGSSTRSWLTSEVREKRGLTYGIGFDLQALPHAAFLAGTLSTSNDKAGEALDVVRQTIRRMANDGPTQAELDDIKTYMTGSYPLRFDNTSAIAGFLTGLQLTHRPITYANIRNGLIEAVTLEQVKKVAKRLLRPDAMVVVAVGRPVGLK
jgi:zinc protease